jgi:hypothetical protein
VQGHPDAEAHHHQAILGELKRGSNEQRQRQDQVIALSDVQFDI